MLEAATLAGFRAGSSNHPRMLAPRAAPMINIVDPSEVVPAGQNRWAGRGSNPRPRDYEASVRGGRVTTSDFRCLEVDDGCERGGGGRQFAPTLAPGRTSDIALPNRRRARAPPENLTRSLWRSAGIIEAALANA
ncbi:hypothetical protein GCM10017786_20190 [Amycolatopsis deserti]|uniref:Uncharacterized protein n=1 Tax=Amycolatopsis deserti TaxID=185696 RepID=A0ABQ3ILU1_9PSEU|nr:hypothetical protein GCM10017786_20190 [Amycolatopsis deserti]